jgi:hypothetical protein
VFSEAPVRQWILSFLFVLLFLIAAQSKILSQVLPIVHRGTSTFLVRRTGFTMASGARTGAVTLIQAASSATLAR